MELIIENTQGVPPESIISIRVGNIRRQVPVSQCHKPFRFPFAPEACGDVKVDVLCAVASARVACSNVGQSYSLDLSRRQDAESGHHEESNAKAENMTVTFSVRPVKDVSALDKALPCEKRKTRESSDKYFEDHRFLEFLQGLVQGVLAQKPADPYAFVANQFVTKTGKDLSQLEKENARLLEHVAELKKSTEKLAKQRENLKAELDASAAAAFQDDVEAARARVVRLNQDILQMTYDRNHLMKGVEDQKASVGVVSSENQVMRDQAASSTQAASSSSQT